MKHPKRYQEMSAEERIEKSDEYFVENFLLDMSTDIEFNPDKLISKLMRRLSKQRRFIRFMVHYNKKLEYENRTLSRFIKRWIENI